MSTTLGSILQQIAATTPDWHIDTSTNIKDAQTFSSADKAERMKDNLSRHFKDALHSIDVMYSAVRGKRVIGLRWKDSPGNFFYFVSLNYQ